MNVNIIVLGSGRHGKDTFAEMLCAASNGQLTFTSSSKVACDLFIFRHIKDKYGYQTEEQCFDDRENRREDWADLITAYNTPNKIRLASYIFSLHNIYVGMRRKDEFNACINCNMINYIFWVDASERCAAESKASMDITYDKDIMAWIDNNKTKAELSIQANTAWECIRAHGKLNSLIFR